MDLDADGSPAAVDCDDNNNAVYPGAEEICDGLDQDCDLAIDEGLPDADGDGLPDCRDPELCDDGGDDDGDGLIDEACGCEADGGATVADGYTLREFVRISEAIGAYGRLGDVEAARPPYGPEGGLLVTINAANNGAAGVAILNAEGTFEGWLIDPDDGLLAYNPYLEHGYDGALFACTTVNGASVFKIDAEGGVEVFAPHGNCEGITYGDAGDGEDALYVSNWGAGTVSRVSAEGVPTQIGSGLGVVVDLGLPRPASAFAAGVYAIGQSAGGIYRLSADGSTNDLVYPYGNGFSGGEEFSFAWPDSPFGDAIYHQAHSVNEVQRVDPDGSLTVIASGGGMSFGTYTIGGAFSDDGRFYYFTNEEEVIWRLQACDAP